LALHATGERFRSATLRGGQVRRVRQDSLSAAPRVQRLPRDDLHEGHAGARGHRRDIHDHPRAADRFRCRDTVRRRIVRLDDGVKVTAQIVDVDLDELRIGQRVRVEFRRVQKEGEAGSSATDTSSCPLTRDGGRRAAGAGDLHQHHSIPARSSISRCSARGSRRRRPCRRYRAARGGSSRPPNFELSATMITLRDTSIILRSDPTTSVLLLLKPSAVTPPMPITSTSAATRPACARTGPSTVSRRGTGSRRSASRRCSASRGTPGR